MKNCIIALMCLLLAPPVFAFGSYKKLDFLNGESAPQSNKILYEYVLQEQNMTPERIKDFARIEPQSVKAFEVDLNDDGTKEILGVSIQHFIWVQRGILCLSYKNNLTDIAIYPF